MKYKYLIIIVLCLTVQKVFSQDTASVKEYSINELKEHAKENNYEIKNSELDIKIAKYLKWETTSVGLPHVSAVAEYQNFPDIPTQLMPDFLTPAIVGVNTGLFGLTPLAPLPTDNKFPVQFGSKHNASWGITASQLVFSGEYIVGLKASKTYLSLSNISLEKKESEINQSIENTAYLILISDESIAVLDSMHKNLKILLEKNRRIEKEGFLEKTDIDQLELNVKNTESSLNSFRRQKIILSQLLKLQSGIPESENIIISDTLEVFTEKLKNSYLETNNFDVSNTHNYKLLDVQENLAELDMMREESKYLPTVAAYYSYSKKAMRDSFDIFTSDAEWYPTSVWGVKVDIPIFSSGQRLARVKQKRFELEKIRNTKQQVSQAMNVEFYQTSAELVTIMTNLELAEQNKSLSKNIYEISLRKYKEGTESDLDLTMKQNQYFTALSNYYQTLINAVEKYLKLKYLVNKTEKN